MTEEELMNEGQTARFTGVSRRTLQGWRVRGNGPPFLRLGRKMIRYLKSDVIAWAEAGRRTSTSDPGPEGR